ncbi:hypothetical protein BO94DRAFT_544562 [Aspergillus sclerotioniger CBS 115572]|uniref:Uncharacterized protein n=1 Tax=Aspergillus sclerotioniger CBS 115572 TaxID=1450535 RepID=A0A317WZR5_9EURO|nr:hypothetical protein BO94DRAFT_544562 [Aspergillus sclerotioniger CBS 115572]PWY91859.1 hypothetical protein BO94DRAFT_544562 [Aspergillus sclerotioniger CBS 115572]
MNSVDTTKLYTQCFQAGLLLHKNKKGAELSKYIRNIISKLSTKSKNNLNNNILSPGQPASAEEQPDNKNEDPTNNGAKDPKGDKDEKATDKEDKQPAGGKDEAVGDGDKELVSGEKKDSASEEDENATGASVVNDVNRSAKEIWKEHGLKYMTVIIKETETTILYEE